MKGAVDMAMPAKMPTKPKPSLHIDLEDIEHLGDAEFGDTLHLKVTVKVKGISQDEYTKGATNLRLEVLKAELMERDLRTRYADKD